MTKLNYDQICTICDSFEAANGKPSKHAVIKALAARFGVSKSAISYQLLRNGIDPWSERRLNGRGRETSLKPDVAERVMNLSRQGMTTYRIAKEIGLPKSTALIHILRTEIRSEAGAA